MNEFMKLLVWQMAQILGYEGENELAEHSILLLVDYDIDAFHPVFVGKSLELGGMGPDMTWTEDVRILTTQVIAEEYRKEMGIFFSEQASRRKLEKGRVYDSINYVSKFSGGNKWTHCIQYLFESTESINEITERLRAELPFCNSSRVLLFDVVGAVNDGHCKRTGADPVSVNDAVRRTHLMSFYLVIEVDAIRKSLESLRYLARHDQLTGLYNRHMMAEIVKDEPSTVIIIDIDKFKGINDKYGHNAGDEALCALANRLEVIFWHHNRDMIFRLGGDEFLVVMKDEDSLDASDAGEDVEGYIEQLCEPMMITTSENQNIGITVSVGYARCVDNFKAALKKADLALYRVKENGRNGYLKAE